MASVRIPPEHGYSLESGSYGVVVRAKAESKLEKSASMEILHDEFLNYEHTEHTAVLPWNGKKVNDCYVERLLNLAKVPANIQDWNAVSMVQRCVQAILKDPKRPRHCSVYVEVMTDKDTGDYSYIEDLDDEEEVPEEVLALEEDPKEENKDQEEDPEEDPEEEDPEEQVCKQGQV